MFEATKAIDASFVNVMAGIGVKLNNVAWLGAKTVTNVVKIGKQFAAYGNHMEWLTGDSAKLTVGTTDYALTCVESDVAHAVFNWPAGLAPEAGTLAKFEMKSRGGVEDGEVYTSKKEVTVLAADPLPPPTITCFSTRATGTDDHAYDMATKGYVRGTNLTLGTGGTVTVERKASGASAWTAVTGVTVNTAESTATQIVLNYAAAIASMDDQVRATVVIGGNSVTSNAVTVTDEA